MIGIGLLLLICFGVLFFLVLPTMAFIIWLNTYNKTGIILNEVGEDENDAIVKYVKLKAVRNEKVGGIIKFHPFSNFKVAKRFDSRDWTSIKTKKKLKEGIILYRQGDNFRPVELKHDEEGFYLNVRDENNTKFLMQYEIMKDRKKESNDVMKWTVVSFFVFLGFISLLTVCFIWAVMDGQTKSFFLYQGAQIIAG